MKITTLPETKSKSEMPVLSPTSRKKLKRQKNQKGLLPFPVTFETLALESIATPYYVDPTATLYDPTGGAYVVIVDDGLGIADPFVSIKQRTSFTVFVQS